MYLSLYRKWRPRVFDEISGQEHITSILKKQCASNRVSHAYLFCGTRGTGKTSSAKILAKAVNCEHPIEGNPCNECASCKSIDNGSATDVLEIDAASNNKVDNIRDLREEVVYPPSVLKKRVYIVDEVHMLTDSAFNALLKTLEEPPEYVVFILATTELNQLPPTIISRCIRFDFSRIDESAVKQRLEFVAKEENINISSDAASLISRLADGSMRDALSLLEACSNGHNEEITTEIVRNVLGLASDDVIFDLLKAISDKDIPTAIDIVNTIHKSSKDISVFIDDLSVVVRDIIIEKQLTKFNKAHKYSGEKAEIIKELSNELLFYISNVLEETQSRISKYATNKRIILEMSIIKMCDRSVSDSTKALAARIADLEKRIAVLSAAGYTPNPAHSDVTIENTKKEEPITSVEIKQERILFAQVSDVYEFLSTNASLYGFMQQATVYIEEEHIVICASKIVIDMLSEDKNRIILSEAFASVLGKFVDIKFEEESEVKKETNGQVSFIDEL